MIVRVLVGGMLVLLSLPILLPLIFGTLITGAIHGLRALGGRRSPQECSGRFAARRVCASGARRGGGACRKTRGTQPDGPLEGLATLIAMCEP